MNYTVGFTSAHNNNWYRASRVYSIVCGITNLCTGRQTAVLFLSGVSVAPVIRALGQENKMNNDKNNPNNARLKEIRSMLEHENNLIDHRLTWMGTLQGLLFTAFAVLTTDGKHYFPTLIISIVGVVSCISVAYSLYWSNKELEKLGDHSSVFFKILSELPPDSKKEKNCLSKYNFLWPWLFLPWVFCIAWTLLFFYSLYNHML